MKRGLRTMAVVVLTGAITAAPLTIVLAGCGRAAVTSPTDRAETYVSKHVATSYEGALPAASQLALGTMLLDGTAIAVTPDQARALLPLWQALRGGSLQGQVEVNAVLGQVERTMTAEQLSAIAAMQLTRDRLLAWAQERGIGLPQSPGGTPGVPAGGGSGEAPEARQTMRAQWQATARAGGAPFGGTPFSGTPSAGWTRRGGFGGADTGQLRFLLDPLIGLLTQRAGS